MTVTVLVINHCPLSLIVHRDDTKCWHELTQRGHETSWMNPVGSLTHTRCVSFLSTFLPSLSSPPPFHPLPAFTPVEVCGQKFSWSVLAQLQAPLIITLDYRGREGSWRATAKALSAGPQHEYSDSRGPLTYARTQGGDECRGTLT